VKQRLQRIMVTGAAGLLGRKLLQGMRDGFDVFAVDIHKPSDAADRAFYQLDIADRESLSALMRHVQPRVVVHTAAFTNVDGCETERALAWRVNVEGTANVAEACREVGTKLVHLSSDYVFDGTAGPYGEDDDPHPICYYGVTKWESERRVRAILDDYIIARTTILYGYATNARPNFATWVISMLTSGKRIRVVTDQVGTPTLADNLAEMIARAIALDKQGVYNMVGRELIDRYRFAVKIAEGFGLDPSLIEPVTSDQLQQTAQRPPRAGLTMERTTRQLGLQALGVEEGLLVLKRQMMGKEQVGGREDTAATYPRQH